MTPTPPPSRLSRWGPVIAWTLSIWVAIPFVRALEAAFRRMLPREAVGLLVVAVIVGAGLGAAIALVRRRHRLDLLTVAVITATIAIFVWWTTRLWREPVEAVHFIQYGGLGALLFRAWRPLRPDLTAHLAAALAGLALGICDELIQWLTPGRFWDLRDVVINGSAAALVQPTLWRLAPPRRPLTAQSLRLPVRLLAGVVGLLTLCSAATPSRVAALTRTLPVLEPLVATHNPIAEYGHRHVVVGEGAFRSRLTLAELAAADRTRSDTVAALVDRYRGGRYGAFLHDFGPADDPFAYELRVHLFARDANFEEATKLAPGDSARVRRMTVAARENQLVETYFSRTLAASSYRWTDDRREQVSAEADWGRWFESRAGRHLLLVSERRLRAVLLLVLVTLAALHLTLGRHDPADGRS